MILFKIRAAEAPTQQEMYHNSKHAEDQQPAASKNNTEVSTLEEQEQTANAWLPVIY